MWYVIDAVDRVADLCEDWDATAERDGAPELTRTSVLGRPIWSFIDGQPTRFHYAQVFENARQTGVASEFRLRADSPGREALLSLTVTPQPDQSLRIDVETLHEIIVPNRPLWDMQVPRNGESALVCSWCKSVETHGNWSPVEQAEHYWPELTSTRPPEVRHHVCPTCDAAMAQVRQAMMTYADKVV